MELLTTAQIKNFLKIEFTDDDSLIETLGDGAESYIKNHLNISSSFAEALDDDGINASKIAMYQLVSHWYTNRNMAFSGGNMDDVGLKIINPLRDSL